jgi:hypothetical protein
MAAMIGIEPWCHPAALVTSRSRTCTNSRHRKQPMPVSHTARRAFAIGARTGPARGANTPVAAARARR